MTPAWVQGSGLFGFSPFEVKTRGFVLARVFLELHPSCNSRWALLAQLGHYADFRGFALKPSNLEDWMVDEEPPGAVMSILC